MWNVIVAFQQRISTSFIQYCKRLKWVPIPLGVGFAYIGYQQYRHIRERELSIIQRSQSPEELLAKDWQVQWNKIQKCFDRYICSSFALVNCIFMSNFLLFSHRFVCIVPYLSMLYLERGVDCVPWNCPYGSDLLCSSCTYVYSTATWLRPANKILHSTRASANSFVADLNPNVGQSANIKWLVNSIANKLIICLIFNFSPHQVVRLICVGESMWREDIVLRPSCWWTHRAGQGHYVWPRQLLRSPRSSFSGPWTAYKDYT